MSWTLGQPRVYDLHQNICREYVRSDESDDRRGLEKGI